MKKNTPEDITILVVDDENEFKEVLKEVFQMAGYTCLTASNGKEALKVLDKNNVDLVLTDIVMPKMDGIRLTEIIKEKYDSQVIMMTGYVKDFTRKDAMDKGASEFINKPLDIKKLLGLVKSLLGKKF
jgi:CheY-like chemotaxis protein